MRHIIIFHFLTFFVFCYTVCAQDKVLHVVTEEGDHPAHGITIYINGKAQASTNVSGQAVVQYKDGDTLYVRSIAYEPISRILADDTPAWISIALKPRIHRLKEVTVKPVDAAKLMKNAFYSLSDQAMMGSVMIRQYLSEDGNYNKVSEGVGLVYLPVSIWDMDQKKGRMAHKHHIMMDIKATCLPHTDQKTNAVYAFDPTELIVRGLTSNTVFTSLYTNDTSTIKLLVDDEYWYITISQWRDPYRHVQAEWVIDKNSGQLVSASEKQTNDQISESHRFEFEFLSISGSTYLYRAFHEHTKGGRKTAYIGGQEMFFSFEGSWDEQVVKKTFNPKRPDLSKLKKELIDCVAVRDYMQNHHLPHLLF